ncbi:GGDEF domain-containing protein [Alicyclobacillus acidiphilus]|uniref:GGDEF domain-containing protein n=1 Tax=Alicyclobacillus acidiphilus TaxID=182455 RepID=UPI0008311D26|nr:GGDEF domain-containing protein [Alicyclobacillus acidiphilus]
MHSLKTLIEQSRDWASLERGRDLFSKVADVLQHTFGIESGMFVYRKPFVHGVMNAPVRVYEPWGIGYSETELTRFIDDGAWFSGEDYFVSESWLPAEEAPPVWKQVWLDAGVQYVGAWKLVVKGSCVGAMVLGRRTVPDEMDADMMAACAIHVSLVLEMLVTRRIAEHASCHDPLTDILNRRGFEQEFGRMQRQDEGSLILGMLDLNEFKGINDNLGHLEGDSILMDVAQTLRKNIGKQGIAARFGGDEFVFLVKTESENIEAITKRVMDWFSDKEYSVSVGCATLGQDGVDWISCLGVADQRLYERKSRRVVLE